jgi:tight adherence protein B
MLPGELWIIYALAFGAAALGVQGLYWYFFRNRREQKAINRRIALAAELSNPTAVLAALRRERGADLFPSIKAFDALRRLLVQTGLRVSLSRLIVWFSLLAAGLYGAFFVLVGSNPLGFALAPTAALALVYLFLLRTRGRRLRRFGEQLPDAIDVIVRGLRAGHPFRVAIELVSREMPDPIGSECGILSDEITYGLEQRGAIDNLVQRVGLPDLAFLSIAINIQSQTGGNLAEILSRLSVLLRQRLRMRLKVRVITAEGRMSALFLSLTPFVLFGVITLVSPGYFGEISNHPLVPPAVVVGASLLILGNFVLYRMVNFKY